ncbi:MAG: hypothetical protein ABI232_02715 [Jatrophihabitantaceae bacterium]
MTSDFLPVDGQTTGVIERIDEPLTLPAVGVDETALVESAAPAAPSVIEVITPATTETLTCPECGTSASVTVNRREATDFCRTCDYPLFWTPSRVYYDNLARSADETLRRLPGTVGRATVASLPCPHCAEPNALTAQICVRCGLSMYPVQELAPEPEPVYAPPPPPAVYVEPDRGVAWWVWALLALGAAALITLIVLIATHTIH